MAEPLVVNLLGPPRFSQAKAPVTCASRKALGLFAYMLLSSRVHARRELAALLWGRGDEETARASLRVALHRLPTPMAECLRIDRDSIELAASPLIDVARFEELARADDLASLEHATELYQGELLQDFEADATPEFDDWLHAQRTRIAQVAQQAFDGAIARRADRARQDGARATIERESALATGQRWATLMPGAEAAHRWLMQLYLDMGRRDAALAQYDVCQRFLAVNYGRAPSVPTRDLYESALGRPAAAERPVGQHADAAGRHEPVARSRVPATSFVGRIEELAELDRLLADANCRLLTLHGLGGAGKTRLAHALATQVAGRFAQGVTWVALERIESADALPAAIAAGLGRELPPRGDRARHVASMLAGQQRLVVLDNFEPLLEQPAPAPDSEPITVITHILQAAPLTRILVTSRQVLSMQEEWVYDVRGLPFEPQATGVSAAVELFAQRARQAYLGFSLAAERPHVQRICHAVEGLPLGLELAAAWVRTIPCGDIAAEIEREAAAIASPHRNRAERHQSLEAVTRHSWKLLRPEEQGVLAGLSAFAGGFTREAAENVADASMRILSTLVDKSLVRRHVDGRYDLHELVRQFAWDKLSNSRARHAAMVRRHAESYSMLLLALLEDVRSPAEASAMARMAGELANFMAAWSRSLAAGTREVVERLAPSIIAALLRHGRVPAALAAAEQAIAALGKDGRADVQRNVRIQWGRAAITAGAVDVAKRELELALALARESGNAHALARCLYQLAGVEYRHGNLDRMHALANEAMPLARAAGDAELVAVIYHLLGGAANARSEFAVAEAHMRAGLAAAREQGAPSLIGALLCMLAVPLSYRGEYAEAAMVNDEAAALYEQLGNTPFAITVRNNSAAIRLAQGDLAGAREQVEIAIDKARETVDRSVLAAALNTLVEILIEQGELAAARAAADEAIAVPSAMDNPLLLTEALFLLATIETREGRHAQALDLLRRLHDELARRPLELRVPMLIIGVAEMCAATGSGAPWRRWLGELCAMESIDATLREKARRLLGAAGIETPAQAMTLAEIEAEVAAVLART